MVVPGPAFREAFFSLQPGSTAVAANEPETAYYAMVLERRDTATFAALYAPNGEEFRFKSLAREQADRQLINDWMASLRREAGVPPTGCRPTRPGRRTRRRRTGVEHPSPPWATRIREGETPSEPLLDAGSHGGSTSRVKACLSVARSGAAAKVERTTAPPPGLVKGG